MDTLALANSTQLAANSGSAAGIKDGQSPLRTGRRTRSWGRDPRSRGRVRIGGTDRCTSAAATAWAPSWRLPWFSAATHSAAFIQKKKKTARGLTRRTKKVNITGDPDLSADRRRPSDTSMTHDNHTFPFRASSTVVTPARPPCCQLTVAPWWCGRGRMGHLRITQRCLCKTAWQAKKI